MKKLDDAKRRFGMIEGSNPRLFVGGEEFVGYKLDDGSVNADYRADMLGRQYPKVPLIETADTGDVKGLQARNLRLKMEINRLNEMLNDRDELIDGMRNPKPLKWVAAALLVGLVFVAHHYGFM